MPDLKAFINEFKHGFQSTTRFRVQVFVKPEMVANIVAESSLLGLADAALSIPQSVKWLAQGLLATSASVPDRVLDLTPLQMYGITEQVPVHTTYTHLSVSFLMPLTTNVKLDNGVPRFFNYWQNQIQNATDGPASGLDFRFPSHYYATILVTLLDLNDNGTVSYQFDNAFPAGVGKVQLSWNGFEGAGMLPVDFTYSYWKVVPHLESVGLSTITNVVNRII